MKNSYRTRNSYSCSLYRTYNNYKTWRIVTENEGKATKHEEQVQHMKKRDSTWRTGTAHEEQVQHLQNSYRTRRTATAHAEHLQNMKNSYSTYRTWRTADTKQLQNIKNSYKTWRTGAAHTEQLQNMKNRCSTWRKGTAHTEHEERPCTGKQFIYMLDTLLCYWSGLKLQIISNIKLLLLTKMRK